MKSHTFEFELLTHCFLAGTRGHERAELRVPSIRGQLRWWFRTLGGFAGLRPRMGLREQENLVFGTTAGENGASSRLRLQIELPKQPLQEIVGKGQVGSPGLDSYLVWPFEQNVQGEENKRACLTPVPQNSFRLRVHWLGDPKWWESIEALITVFGHLGALGCRSRRAMGALGFVGMSPNLPKALARFATPTSITLRQENAVGYPTRDGAIAALARWLKGWRQHGQQDRTWIWNDRQDHTRGGSWKAVSDAAAVASPGFPFARRDHNEGIRKLTGTYPSSDPKPPQHNSEGTTYRAALGLPITQLFSSIGNNYGPSSKAQRTVTWELGTGAKKGRFASPVILRAYRESTSLWRAVIIFVDAHQWPSGQKVHLNGSPFDVSLDLYDEMKRRTPTVFP